MPELYIYIIGRDLFMCYNVDLCMYLLLVIMYYDVLEDYNIDPGRDRRLALRLVRIWWPESSGHRPE